VQKHFAGNFPETLVPHRNKVRRLTEKFHETSSVLDEERSGRPSKFSDKKLMNISGSMLRGASKHLNSKRCSILDHFISLLEADKITYSWFQEDGAHS
jgi:hypothetical protein